MRKDNESVMFKGSSGEVRPYPSGLPKNVADEVNALKLNAFDECVEVVRTATGAARHVSIEGSVGGVGRLNRELIRKHPNGKPVFLRASEYRKLNDQQRRDLLDDAHRASVSGKPAEKGAR